MLHLLDSTGKIIPFEFLCNKYNLVDRRQYNNLIKAIPQSVVMMSYNLKQNNVNPTLPSLLINGHNLTDQKIRNVMIRQLFVQELYPYLSNRLSILQFFSKKEAENLKSKFFKFPIAPKAKEVHFKILNKVYPSSEFLRNRFNLDHNNCLFCEENIETTDHLFYECKFVDVFWNDLYDWLFPKVPNLSILSKESILMVFVLRTPPMTLSSTQS